MPRKALIGVCSLAALAFSAPGAQAARTWAGTWSSTAGGEMVLDTKGSGTYSSGRATIRGGVNGDLNKGTWDNGNGTTGTFEFRLEPDGHSFLGTANYDDPQIAGRFAWNGVCTAGPCLQNSESDDPGGELPDPGFYYPPRSAPHSEAVSATLKGSKADFGLSGSKCSSHNVNFDYSLGGLRSNPVHVNRKTGKFSDTVGAIETMGSADAKWVELKFTGRFYPKQMRGTVKLTVDSKKKPKCEAKWDFLSRVED
jgi:hypothetical protein